MLLQALFRAIAAYFGFLGSVLVPRALLPARATTDSPVQLLDATSVTMSQVVPVVQMMTTIYEGTAASRSSVHVRCFGHIAQTLVAITASSGDWMCRRFHFTQST